MKRKLIIAPKSPKTNEFTGVLLNGISPNGSHLSLGNDPFYALPFNFTFVLRFCYLYQATPPGGIHTFLRKGGTGTNRWAINKSGDSSILQFGFIPPDNTSGDSLGIPFSYVKRYDWTHMIVKREGNNTDTSTQPGWATSIRNPDNIKIYIDSVYIPWTFISLFDSSAGVRWDFSNNDPFFIGKYDSTTPLYTKMMVDYFGYYDRALSQEEITNCFKTNNLPSLGSKAMFNFNGNLFDSSSVKNNIQIIGNTYSDYLEFPTNDRTALFKNSTPNQMYEYAVTESFTVTKVYKDQAYTVQYSTNGGLSYQTFVTGSAGEYDVNINVPIGNKLILRDGTSRPLSQIIIFNKTPYTGVFTYKNVYVTYNSNLKSFTIYSKLNANNYYSKITLSYILNNSTRSSLWRVVAGELVQKINDGFILQNINLLTDGENEFVFREENKSDFTGGYHGDELLTSISAILDGVSLGNIDTLSSFNLKEGDISFVFTQNSNMLETDNTTNTVIANHIKQDTFLFGGYESKNTLTASRNIVMDNYYHGIVCITTDIAKYAKNDAGTVRTMTRGGNDVTHFLALSGGHNIEYWNDTNGLSAIVHAEILNNPSRDNIGITTTKDTTRYGKYYRTIPVFTMNNGETIESNCKVVFNKV